MCVYVYIVLKLATEMLFIIVNSLKDQLEDLKRRNQNSQISTEKVNQLQRQVSWSQFVIRILKFTYDCLLIVLIGNVQKGFTSNFKRKSLGRIFRFLFILNTLLWGKKLEHFHYIHLYVFVCCCLTLNGITAGWNQCFAANRIWYCSPVKKKPGRKFKTDPTAGIEQ